MSDVIPNDNAAPVGLVGTIGGTAGGTNIALENAAGKLGTTTGDM